VNSIGICSSLADAGVDKNLAKDARKMGSIPEAEFKERLERWRRSVNGGDERISTKLPGLPKVHTRRRAENISLKDWDTMSADEQAECLNRENYPSDLPMNAPRRSGHRMGAEKLESDRRLQT